MPPALRRSVSSPSVRVAPYPTSSPSHPTSAVNSAANSAAVLGRPRRGASESAGRRVLADIEWWRVVQGQQGYECETDARENEVAAVEGDDARPRDIDTAAPVRPRTPEPTSPLYTVSEDAHTDPAAPDSEPSSAASTPSRPRAHHSLSFPGLTLAALRIEDDAHR